MADIPDILGKQYILWQSLCSNTNLVYPGFNVILQDVFGICGLKNNIKCPGK